MFSRRHFSLDEANLLLPRVSEHMGRAMQLHVILRAVTSGLEMKGRRVTAALLEGRGDPPWSMTEGEMRQLEQARALHLLMHEELDAIARLGGEVRGLSEGLVDFWSYLNGETEVLLCWRMGERVITHYHLPEAGYAGRRTIAGAILSPERRVSPTIHPPR